MARQKTANEVASGRFYRVDIEGTKLAAIVIPGDSGGDDHDNAVAAFKTLFGITAVGQRSTDVAGDFVAPRILVVGIRPDHGLPVRDANGPLKFDGAGIIDFFHLAAIPTAPTTDDTVNFDEDPELSGSSITIAATTAFGPITVLPKAVDTTVAAVVLVGDGDLVTAP